MNRSIERLVRALCRELAWWISIVNWNTKQVSWGGDNDSFGDSYSSTKIGAVDITVEVNEDAGCRRLTISFDGVSVSTWIGTKRLFYMPDASAELSALEWVSWFERAWVELGVANDKSLAKHGICGEFSEAKPTLSRDAP